MNPRLSQQHLACQGHQDAELARKTCQRLGSILKAYQHLCSLGWPKQKALFVLRNVTGNSRDHAQKLLKVVDGRELLCAGYSETCVN